MYRKKLFIIPPAGGKTRFIVPEIIRNEKKNGKTIFWLSENYSLEYSGLSSDDIKSLTLEEWSDYPYEKENTYQIICYKYRNDFVLIDEPLKLFHKMAKDTNNIIIIDAAASIIGQHIIEILYKQYAADIYLLFDSIDQVYGFIDENIESNLDLNKAHKFLASCRKEFNTYKKNHRDWIKNRCVEKIKLKKGEDPITQPLPNYLPSEIFGCTLYHYKQAFLPGMTIEEMINKIRG